MRRWVPLKRMPQAANRRIACATATRHNGSSRSPHGATRSATLCDSGRAASSRLRRAPAARARSEAAERERTGVGPREPRMTSVSGALRAALSSERRGWGPGALKIVAATTRSTVAMSVGGSKPMRSTMGAAAVSSRARGLVAGPRDAHWRRRYASRPRARSPSNASGVERSVSRNTSETRWPPSPGTIGQGTRTSINLGGCAEIAVVRSTASIRSAASFSASLRRARAASRALSARRSNNPGWRA